MEGPAQGERSRLESVYSAYQNSGAAKRWDLANRGNQAIKAERDALLRTFVASVASGVHLPRVLEIGCGFGGALREIPREQVGLSVGVDLLRDRVVQARRHLPYASFCLADGGRLPFASNSFDVAACFTLFSSVLSDDIRAAIASEIERVLAVPGHVIVFDLRVRNPRNHAVKPISEVELGGLFPEFDLRSRRLTLLPPLARRLGPLTPLAYPLLARLPALLTHRMTLLSRSSAR